MWGKGPGTWASSPPPPTTARGGKCSGVRMEQEEATCSSPRARTGGWWQRKSVAMGWSCHWHSHHTCAQHTSQTWEEMFFFIVISIKQILIFCKKSQHIILPHYKYIIYINKLLKEIMLNQLIKNNTEKCFSFYLSLLWSQIQIQHTCSRIWSDVIPLFTNVSGQAST